MDKMKVLLIEDDLNDIALFEEYLKTTPDVELVGISKGSTEGFDKTLRLQPNAVILDLELGEGNGIEYLYRLKAVPAEDAPFVVVVTNTTSKITLQEVRENGAGFVFVKTIQDFHPSQVVDFLRRTSKYFMGDQPYSAYRRPSVNEEGRMNMDVMKRIFETDLEKMKVKLSSKGGRYLLQSIMLVYTHPELIDSLMSEVYPRIAKENHTDTRNVERNVRACIESAWGAKGDELHEYYTAPVDPERGKPTSKEFIHYFARKHLPNNSRKAFE